MVRLENYIYLQKPKCCCDSVVTNTKPKHQDMWDGLLDEVDKMAKDTAKLGQELVDTFQKNVIETFQEDAQRHEKYEHYADLFSDVADQYKQAASEWSKLNLFNQAYEASRHAAEMYESAASLLLLVEKQKERKHQNDLVIYVRMGDFKPKVSSSCKEYENAMSMLGQAILCCVQICDHDAMDETVTKAKEISKKVKFKAEDFN